MRISEPQALSLASLRAALCLRALCIWRTTWATNCGKLLRKSGNRTLNPAPFSPRFSHFYSSIFFSLSFDLFFLSLFYVNVLLFFFLFLIPSLARTNRELLVNAIVLHQRARERRGAGRSSCYVNFFFWYFFVCFLFFSRNSSDWHWTRVQVAVAQIEISRVLLSSPLS